MADKFIYEGPSLKEGIDALISHLEANGTLPPRPIEASTKIVPSIDNKKDEDLESEFMPSGDSAKNTAPDLDAKDQLLEETNASINRRKGDYKVTNNFILSSAVAGSGFSAWVGPDGGVLYVPQGKDHMDVVFGNPEVFGFSLDDLSKYSNFKNSDDGILDELYSNLYVKGWVRIRNFNKVFFVSCAEPLLAASNMRQWADDVLSTGILKDATEVSFSGKDFHSSKVFTLGELAQASFRLCGKD
ncbi:MAG: hypothetical protein FWH35_00040 [Treponema sp.]|nr:hypothetical protein [Treponema sp.]